MKKKSLEGRLQAQLGTLEFCDVRPLVHTPLDIQDFRIPPEQYVVLHTDCTAHEVQTVSFRLVVLSRKLHMQTDLYFLDSDDKHFRHL